MGKFGRNQPCHCGSGKKFKYCHGSFGPAIGASLPSQLVPKIKLKLQEMDALKRRRQQQQGLGRPIISEHFSGERVVAVGGRLYHSSTWHSFHDFLRDYLLGSLGPEWSNAEQSKPLEERHQILRWYAQASEHAEKLRVRGGEMISGPMSGAMRAFMNLAYNIYLIAHHSEGQAMADIYLRRLKSSRADDFNGALFETYAAAAFLKAGFNVAYEETRRRATSCVEFVACWPKTGEKFSVEVKTRVHSASSKMPVDDMDHAKRLRVDAKLLKALAKSAEHMRVVMIEVNIPDLITSEDRLDGWVAAAVSQIRGKESAIRRDGTLYPPAYVFVTNHSFHHDLTGTGGAMQVVADGFRISDFGPEVRYRGYAEILATRERHSAMMALIDSMRTHYEIPATFDGELPGTLKSSEAIAPMQIGQRYMVPNGSGLEVPGCLTSATVLKSERMVYGTYALEDGRTIIATTPLTDDEFEDYCLYPDTFFNTITPVVEKAPTFIDKCDFLLKTYQHSKRDKLLEFLASAPDIEQLKMLNQRDLAIIYCERIALVMQSDEDGKASHNSEKL